MQATVNIPEKIAKEYHLQKDSYSWNDLKSIFWGQFLEETHIIESIDPKTLTTDQLQQAEETYNKKDSELLDI